MATRLSIFISFLFVAFTTAYDISYDETLAVDVLRYSSAAYCPTGKVSSWSGLNSECASDTSGFKVLGTFSAVTDDDEITTDTHAFGYVGVDTKRGWVVGAFKGSNQTADFITDLNGGLRIFSDCTINGVDFGRVHKGFCSYYKDLANEGFTTAFINAVKSYPSYKPVLTGHSLGATAAVLAARDVNEQGGIYPYVYTFGQPRVGNYDFSSDFAERVATHYRVVHRADMVAHLPMCCGPTCRKWSDCAYHTWDEIWYNNDMDEGDTYNTCDGGEDSSCEKYIDLSINDHTHYFNIAVGSYCCK